jgi:hypothetical protein
MRKTNPLTKQRFKPQVSAAFGSVSILIKANGINPQNFDISCISEVTESSFEVCCDLPSTILKCDRPFHIGVSLAIGHGFICRFSIRRYNLEGNTRLRFDVVAWRDIGELNLPFSRVQWSPNA